MGLGAKGPFCNLAEFRFKRVFQLKLTSVKLAAYSHSAADSPKKVESKNTPKRVKESSPTTHVTETRFLHVLDPPDHFGTIYIFDDFFTFGLSFFQQIFPKKVRVQSWQHIHIQQQIRQKKLESKNIPKKVRVQPHNPRHRNPFSPRFRPS